MLESSLYMQAHMSVISAEATESTVCTYQNHRTRHGIRNIPRGILGFLSHTTKSVTFPTNSDKSLLSRSVLTISIQPDLREMTYNTTSNSRILPPQHVNICLGVPT
jgi:hypothetical protein